MLVVFAQILVSQGPGRDSPEDGKQNFYFVVIFGRRAVINHFYRNKEIKYLHFRIAHAFVAWLSFFYYFIYKLLSDNILNLLKGNYFLACLKAFSCPPDAIFHFLVSRVSFVYYTAVGLSSFLKFIPEITSDSY